MAHLPVRCFLKAITDRDRAELNLDCERRSPAICGVMRILLNGREVAALEPGLAARLKATPAFDLAEGMVLTSAQAVESAMGRLRVLYVVVLGIAGAIMLAALWMAASYEPSSLAMVLPVYLVLAGGLAFLVRFFWRRRAAQIEARVAALAGLALGEPGAAVRVDPAGLTVGPAHFPWSVLQVEEVSVVATSFDESTVEFVERLNLASGGRTLVLDTVMLSDGRVIVSCAWRQLCAFHAA
jgi:hypothetical protein